MDATVARVLTIPLVVTITRVVSSGSNQGPIMRAVRDTMIVGLMTPTMTVRVLPAARVLGTLSTLPVATKKPGLPIEWDALVVEIIGEMSNAASVLIATVAGLLLVTTSTSRTIRIHNATRMIGAFDRTTTGSRNRITSTEVKNVPSGRAPQFGPTDARVLNDNIGTTGIIDRSGRTGRTATSLKSGPTRCNR